MPLSGREFRALDERMREAGVPADGDRELTFDDLTELGCSRELAARILRLLGREELLPLMEYALIGCHEGVDEGTDWMLLAAERLFMPFLELLSGDEAASLYEPYRRLRRKNVGLPPQSEILKTLKKMRK